MRSISVFNNKGGVGKTTLTYHLANALAEMGHKTLLIDLDPQCNLTILGMDEETIHEIWQQEDDFIEDFNSARQKLSEVDFKKIISQPRSIHFLLKPTQDGTAEVPSLPPPYKLASNLDLLPGRLTMHLYEATIASRWAEVYQGGPQAIRVVTRIRALAEEYAQQHGYAFVIMDTSPSLGILNKVVISITDGFLIPCMPDMFSLYGIRNIGRALTVWKKEFDTIYHLISQEKRALFPGDYVKLLGYTIFNAKPYAGQNEWDLATAHMGYARQIPEAINENIDASVRNRVADDIMHRPVGGKSIMHSHNTFPSMAQKYHMPMWKLPFCDSLESADASTIKGNRAKYEEMQQRYKEFAADLLSRIELLG